MNLSFNGSGCKPHSIGANFLDMKREKPDKKRRSGIYKITNTITKNFYIGSSIYIKERRSMHFHRLKVKKHFNKFIQEDCDLHGEASFIFEVVEFCEKEDLLIREQYYLDTLKPFYNIHKNALSKSRQNWLKKLKNG